MTVSQNYPFNSRSHFWEVMVSSQPIISYVKIELFFLCEFVCTEFHVIFFCLLSPVLLRSFSIHHSWSFSQLSWVIAPSANFVPSLSTFLFFFPITYMLNSTDLCGDFSDDQPLLWKLTIFFPTICFLLSTSYLLMWGSCLLFQHILFA